MSTTAKLSASRTSHGGESAIVPLKTADREQEGVSSVQRSEDPAPIHTKASTEDTEVRPYNSSDPWQVKEPCPVPPEDECQTDDEHSPGASTKIKKKRRKKRKESRHRRRYTPLPEERSEDEETKGAFAKKPGDALAAEATVPLGGIASKTEAKHLAPATETLVQESGIGGHKDARHQAPPAETTMQESGISDHKDTLASSGPQTSSTSTYAKGRRPTESVSQSVRVALLGGAVATFLLCIIIVAFLNHPPSPVLASNSSDWCGTSQSCRAAREFLRQTVDHSIDPCRNFYGHVCSKWTKKNPFFEGYLDELLHKLRTKIYDQLDEVNDNAVNRELPQVLSIFFKSCYEFIAQKRDLQVAVESALGAFEIDSWKNAATLEDVIPDVVRVSVIIGVPSAFNLSCIRRNTVDIYMDVGTTLSAVYGRRLDDTLKTYLQDVTNIIATGRRGLAIFDVDARLADLYSQAQNATFEPMSANDLQGALKTSSLLSAINRTLQHPTDQVTVHVRGLSAIQNALEIVKELAPYQRNTYLLLLVASKILLHDYSARYLLHGTAEQKECLRITSEYFSSKFYQYVVEGFQSHSVESELSAMESHLRKLTVDSAMSSPWIAASRRPEVADAISGVPVWVGKLDDRVSSANLYHFLGKSFAKNVVLVLKARAKQEVNGDDACLTLPLSHWQFTGTVGFVPEHKLIVTSTSILQPDAFYEDPGTRINYGTVGALLAESFFLAGLADIHKFPSGEENEARRLSCYQSRIERETGHSEGLKELVALKLALNVTYYVNRRDSEASRESDQIFFSRFCLSSCGHSPGHRAVLPGRVRCNLPLLGLREFVEAFGCPAEYGKVPCGEPEWP